MQTQRLFLARSVSLVQGAFANRQGHCPLCAAAQLVHEHPLCAMLGGSCWKGSLGRADVGVEFLHLMGKDQDGQGLWQALRGHCVLAGGAELHPALHRRERKTECLRVASGSQSFLPPEQKDLMASSRLKPSHSPAPQSFDRQMLLYKKNQRTNAIFL